MTLGKVLARGQVTLPRDIRRDADIEPGDTVTFRVTAPGKVEVSVLPRLRLAEALERYRIEAPVVDAADRLQWQVTAAEEVLGGRRE